MKLHFVLLLAVLAMLPLALAACGGGGGGGGGGGTTVTGTEFKFDPGQLTLQNGQPATINFQNKGSVGHDLSIPDLGVAGPVIQPGQSATINVTPNKTGTFRMLCTVPGHADAGMTGQVTVQ